MNRLQKLLHRNKRQCAHCNKWTSLNFVGDWCRECIIEQSQDVLRQIGTIVGMRVRGREVDDLVTHASMTIRAMPEEVRNRDNLWSAVLAAVECDLPEEKK